MTLCWMTEEANVYMETKTDSHTTVHTKTHTPTFIEAAHKVVLFLTASLLTQASQGKASTQDTLLHVSVKNPSIFS